MTTDPKQDKDMLERLARLQRHTGAPSSADKMDADKRNPANDTGKAKTLEEAEQILASAKNASRVFNEVAGAWDLISRPIKAGWSYVKPTYEIGKHAAIKTGRALAFLAPAAKPVWNGYKALFNRMAYIKDDNGNRTILHKPRAVGAVALSLLVAWTGATQGLPFAGSLAYDGIMMATTTEIDKPVYLTGANPYDSTDDVFYVKGCESLPCTDSNSVLYRIRDNTLLSVYRLATTGHAFWPEDIGAAIPEETSACLINTYGFRSRILGMYPHITAVQCAPTASNGQPGTFPPLAP